MIGGLLLVVSRSETKGSTRGVQKSLYGAARVMKCCKTALRVDNVLLLVIVANRTGVLDRSVGYDDMGAGDVYGNCRLTQIGLQHAPVSKLQCCLFIFLPNGEELAVA